MPTPTRWTWTILSTAMLASVGCAQAPSKQVPSPKTTRAPDSPSPAELRPRVQKLLQSDASASRGDDWRQLGPGALQELESVLADATATPELRTRAVRAMGFVDSPDASARLEQIAADRRLDDPLRSAAILGLTRRGGPAASASLGALLEDPHPAIRDSAAQGLGKVGSPDARKLLEDRLGKEENSTVREAIERSITKMEP